MENQVGYGQDDAVYCALVHDLLQGYDFIEVQVFHNVAFHFDSPCGLVNSNLSTLLRRCFILGITYLAGPDILCRCP